MKIEVKELVCDWGIFINGELSKDLIFNSKANAEEVKRIIELDIENKRFDSVHQKVNITMGIISSVLIILIMLAFAVLVLSAFIFMISTIIGGLK